MSCIKDWILLYIAYVLYTLPSYTYDMYLSNRITVYCIFIKLHWIHVGITENLTCISLNLIYGKYDRFSCYSFPTIFSMSFTCYPCSFHCFYHFKKNLALCNAIVVSFIPNWKHYHTFMFSLFVYFYVLLVYKLSNKNGI